MADPAAISPAAPDLEPDPGPPPMTRAEVMEQIQLTRIELGRLERALSLPPGRPLSPRQSRFVQEYRIDGVAAAAARRAGYSARAAKFTGYHLLRDARVRKALRTAPDRDHPELEHVTAELGHLAFANLLDVAVVGPDGRLDLDLTRLDRGRAAAIRELTLDETTDPRTGVTHRRVRFRMADKKDALVKLIATLNLTAKVFDDGYDEGRGEARRERRRGAG